MALRKFLFGTGVVSGTSYLALKYTETGEGFYRFGSTVYCATHVVLDYKWDKYKDPDTPTRMKKELHQRSADRILGLCKQHGGILIKAVQYVGTMNHVLPKEYTSTLSKLQDNAPTLPFEKIKPVLLESLNVNNLDEIFDVFNEKPVAAASLATEDSLIQPIIVFNPCARAVPIILNASVIPPHFINFIFTPST